MPMTRRDTILKWIAYLAALAVTAVVNYYVLGPLPIPLPLLLPVLAVAINSFKLNTFVKTDTFALPTGEMWAGFDNFIKGMAGTMADYEIVSISETPLMDVYKMKVVD